MKQYFIIIHPNGEVEKTLAPDENEHLNFLQKMVGGYIETVPSSVSSDAILIVNEEGKNLNLPENRLATALADLHNDYIVGTAVFTIAAGEDILAMPIDIANMFTEFISKIVT